MPKFTERLAHAWNAFRNNRDPTENLTNTVDLGYSSSYRPDRPRFSRGYDRSIVTAAYNRIAVDVANVNIRHVRLDENGRYKETIKSGLNNCLSVEANLDQTGRQLIQDIVISMFDEGCVAVVPVDTDLNPRMTGGFDILSMRTGKITSWYPDSVKVLLYNEATGRKEEVIVPKRTTAIIENPFYAVMNEPNSMLQRVIRKLQLLDMTDEQNSSGKLDLIIQLPYTVRTEQRMIEAERRRKKIEEQLTTSKYGIAYADATEKITQLNRSIDNNLKEQVDSFAAMLYSQLGIPMEVFNGTADEKTRLCYFNGTIEPILSVIVEEFTRKFLTKTARTRLESILFFQDHFKLVPVNNIADIADKFTRNEILTANEIRSILGIKPSDDPKADELRNSNMPVQDRDPASGEDEPVDPEELKEARQTLLDAGLNESDLADLSDNEIIDLKDEYESGSVGDDEEENSEKESPDENQNGEKAEEPQTNAKPQTEQQQTEETPEAEEAPEEEEEPVDPEELKKAKELLLSLGFSEKELSGLTDHEIIELVEEYQKQNTKEPAEPVPRK